MYIFIIYIYQNISEISKYWKETCFEMILFIYILFSLYTFIYMCIVLYLLKYTNVYPFDQINFVYR